MKRLDKLEKRLARALPSRRRRRRAWANCKLAARTPKATFLKSVLRAKEYIASGDVFQCVLSQRFDCVPGVDAFDIYRALRIVNPSPYMYFLRFGVGRGVFLRRSGHSERTVKRGIGGDRGSSASATTSTIQP